MSEQTVSAALLDSFRDADALLERWVAALHRRSWKLRSGTAGRAAGGAGPEVAEMLRERCRHFLETLRAAMESAPGLEVGGAAYREAVQSLSFTAGWMAGVALPITDAVALVYGLEEVLGWPQAPFFQSLMVVVTEAFTASVAQREHARYRDAMEKCQIVCAPHPRLPVLFLVGEPDRQALDDAVGRVMMLAAMRDAPAVVVDLTALLAPDQILSPLCRILREHADAARAHVMLCGVSVGKVRGIGACASERLSVFETMAEGWEAAMNRVGLAWSTRTAGS